MKKPDFVINTLTGKRIVKPEPVDEEVVFDGGVMISETDRHGIITYANKKFFQMTGYSKEEIIGTPHSILRHPDMPKGVFRSIWKVVSQKKIWRGYIKNLRKDGKYYWVLVYIQPKVDEKGEVVGYIAGRKVAYPDEIRKIERVYEMYRDDRFIDDEIFQCSYDEMIAMHERS